MGYVAAGCSIATLQKHKRIFIATILNLQISRWGNSLAVRIPADYARLIGEGGGSP